MQCITLDMFYILFIVIVDSWNVNKISLSISMTAEQSQYIVQFWPENVYNYLTWD